MEEIVTDTTETLETVLVEGELMVEGEPISEGEPVVEGAVAPDFEQMVLQTVQAIRQIAAAGDQLAAIAILPEWETGFKAALASLAEDVLPAEIRDSLPVEADPNATGVNIITRTDLEVQFLAQHFGARERGGNGLLPLMQEYLNRHQSPVRVTPDFLRSLYLQEVKARLGSQIVTPGQFDLTQVPHLRR